MRRDRKMREGMLITESPGMMITESLFPHPGVHTLSVTKRDDLESAIALFAFRRKCQFAELLERQIDKVWGFTNFTFRIEER
jgi:hypothetical protein